MNNQHVIHFSTIEISMWMHLCYLCALNKNIEVSSSGMPLQMRLVTPAVWLSDNHWGHTLLYVCGVRDRGTVAAQVHVGHGQSAPLSAWPDATLREVTRCLSTCSLLVSSQLLRTDILLKVTCGAYLPNLLCVGSILSLFSSISPFLAVGQLRLSMSHNSETVDSLKQSTFHQMRLATGEDKRQDRRVGIALGCSE